MIDREALAIENARRVSELIQFNNEYEERARLAERVLKCLTTPRPIEEYHEDMGPVLWWKLPIEEPPYVGGPNDLGRSIGVLVTGTREGTPWGKTLSVGGWPGYHTHWTPLPKVTTP